jgi:hypothetical protein
MSIEQSIDVGCCNKKVINKTAYVLYGRRSLIKRKRDDMVWYGKKDN